MAAELHLKVLTLNTWGLWLVSKQRPSRVRHLANYLQETQVDVVLLQEVWVDGDAQLYIQSAARAGLKHSTHFRSGVFGSGLVTLSRFPIIETAFFQYRCSGDPSALTCGDYYAGKGLGWARILTPAGAIDVFNTHTHANYRHAYSRLPHPLDHIRVPRDAAACYRVAQVFELLHHMYHLSKKGSAGVILGGDLNSRPDSLEVALLGLLLPLVDAWAVTRHSDPGYTMKAPGNSYRPRRQVPERIDYIWTSLQVSTCSVTLERTPQGFSYSDHCAVEAHLVLLPPSGAAPGPGTDAGVLQRPLIDSPPLHAHNSPLGPCVAAGLVLMEKGGLAARTSGLYRLLLTLITFASLLMLLVAQLLVSPSTGQTPRFVVLLLQLLLLLLALSAPFLFVMAFLGDLGQARALQQATQQARTLAAKLMSKQQQQQQQ